jgi:V8-like Glu-specific endopeptidase
LRSNMILIILLLMLPAAPFKAAEDRGIDKNVFGPDGRTSMKEQRYPWTAVGKIMRGVGVETYFCSAFMIAPNVVATNAHCTLDKDGGDTPSTLRFYPFYIGNKFTTVSGARKVWRGTKETQKNQDKDWALVQLNLPLGHVPNFRPIAIKKISREEALAGRYALPGYSGDWGYGNTGSIDPECRVHNVVGSFFYHDCDTTTGASGGPLLKKEGRDYAAVGLNSSEFRNAERSLVGLPYADDIANAAIDFNTFWPTIQEALAEAQKPTGKTFALVCHHSWERDLKVMVSIPQGEHFKTIGRFPVKRGNCVEIPLGEGIKGEIFLAAEGEMVLRKRNAKEFLVDKEQAQFTIEKGEADPAEGQVKIPFVHRAEVDPDKVNLITL